MASKDLIPKDLQKYYDGVVGDKKLDLTEDDSMKVFNLYNPMYKELGLTIIGIARVHYELWDYLTPSYCTICRNKDGDIDLYATNDNDKVYIIRYDKEWNKKIKSLNHI